MLPSKTSQWLNFPWLKGGRAEPTLKSGQKEDNSSSRNATSDITFSYEYAWTNSADTSEEIPSCFDTYKNHHPERAFLLDFILHVRARSPQAYSLVCQ